MNNQKNIVTGIVAVVTIIILGAVYYFFGPPSNDRTVVTNTTETIANEDLNFSFSYESGETALSSMETVPEQFGSSTLKKMYMLMETKELESFNQAKANGETREAPPAISILVFDKASTTEATSTSSTATSTNSSVERVKQWAKENNQFTNINLATGNIEETEIDGASAIHYQTDGLYKQDVYVARYGKKMYLFVGQSFSDGDYMQEAFKKVIDSVLFE